MSSVQERLQLKRGPVDTWNIREQLCLASAVVRSGDQNWMSVSRALKTIGEPNRPQDWYSQKSCAAQYGALLEHVETPKRKKRNSEGGVETPQESILKRLTQDRIVEIQKTLAEMNQQYDQLKNEVAELRNPSTSEDRVRDIWNGIEATKRAKEREIARRAALLKEREERRARAERNWRPQSTPTSPNTTPVTPGPPASPLLTSLLKSSPVVTTPQHISHPANVVETVSPSVTAPTLSMLLEKSSSANCSQHESKHAAIEHIKSQLQQIEHQLKASTTPSVLAAPAVDIDDIEIKAEDVYAFRDIDLHMPPVVALHKPNDSKTERPPSKKEDVNITEASTSRNVPVVVEDIKEEPMVVDSAEEDIIQEDVPTPQTTEEAVTTERAPTPEAVTPEVKIAFPEVKFPTTEIKVIQSDEHKIKEEVKEADPVPMEIEDEPVVVEDPPVTEEETVSVEEIEIPPPPQEEQVVVQEECDTVTAPDPEVVVEEKTEVVEEEAVPGEVVEDIPLPVENVEEVVEETVVTDIIPEPAPEITETEVATEEVVAPPEPEVQQETKPETDEVVEEKVAAEVAETEEAKEVVTDDDSKKDEDAEDSIPLKQIVEAISVKKEEQATEDTHTETDDDTPMELSREEEKDGKKKRDYSRKKKSDSRNRSGSESAEASAPESPSASASANTSDAERQHRLWRKSVMLVYSRLCGHKYASLFVRPISDEEAPGYSAAVRRPMDLSALRRNIDCGTLRTTAEFQRDILLMLSNALMYNSSAHSVHAMAKEMHQEAKCQLGMLLAAQAHAKLCEPTPSRRKRRHH